MSETKFDPQVVHFSQVCEEYDWEPIVALDSFAGNDEDMPISLIAAVAALRVRTDSDAEDILEEIRDYRTKGWGS
jgi:hypothetical protein